MAAKAVIVVDSSGRPVVGAEPTLVTDTMGSDVMPLTNSDGYSLSNFGYDATPGHLKVVANGYPNYLQTLSLDDLDQNIMVGAQGGGENAIHLPALKGSGSSFPSYPTREAVCNVFCGFQGISILTSQYGWIPAFGPEVGWLNEEDCISYCEQMKGYGFTHVEMTVSGRYDEPSYQYPVPGFDYTNDLSALATRLTLIIKQGMLVKLSLAGDGMSVNNNPQYGEYNDPQGWTYGFQWAVQNLERIITFLSDWEEHDLNRYILHVPGYDAVFYGWGPPNEKPDLQPSRVINFGILFRRILPEGYLGIEHSTGHIPVGESGIDWTFGGPLDAYDTLLSEYDPFNLHSDPTWQIVGRLTRPYNRPYDQPAWDDPSPPYIIHECTRGARFYIMYELLTYKWVRGQSSIQECNQAYDYFKAMAPNATLCMIRQ